MSHDEQPVTGKLGDVIDTPLGTFAYVGDKPYNIGWLNTATYDTRVFDSTGRLVYSRDYLWAPSPAQLDGMLKVAGVDGRDTTGPYIDGRRRAYVAGANAVFSFDSSGKLRWKQPTLRRVPRISGNSRDDIIFTDSDLTAAGKLWCLAPDGKVRWSVALDHPAYVDPLDSGDNILLGAIVRPHERPEILRWIYSPSGKLLWKGKKYPDQDRNGVWAPISAASAPTSSMAN